MVAVECCGGGGAGVAEYKGDLTGTRAYSEIFSEPPDIMPIPPLDVHGALGIADPVRDAAMSLIQCSLAELHARFVAGLPDEPHRQRLWDGWMRFRNEVEVVGIPYVTWLGGSFLTSKSHPGDIDQCVVIDAADYGLLAPPEQQHLTALMTDPSIHATFGCHAFPITNYPVSHPRFVQASVAFTYWTRVFGIDRADRHRSILCVSERGTV